MNIGSAMLRERDWTASWSCHEFSTPAFNHQLAYEPEWKVGKKPIHRPNVAVVASTPSVGLDPMTELRALADQWKSETTFMSSTHEMFLHPAYQQIIGFGEKALPFLIDELRSTDGFWFWALNMITRQNPVPVDQRGNFRAMKQAWLAWAASKDL